MWFHWRSFATERPSSFPTKSRPRCSYGICDDDDDNDQDEDDDDDDDYDDGDDDDDVHQIHPPGQFKDRDTQIDEYCDRHGDCYCRVDPD